MTIEQGSTGKGGLLDSVKALASTLILMAQTRLELLSTEIEEERAWLTTLMVWTMVALFCAAIAVVLAAMLIVIIFWDSYRILALSILICIFILGAGFAWRVVFNMTNSKPRLFTSSIEEMSKDREQLSPPHE